MRKSVGRCLFTVGTCLLTAWSCAHLATPLKSATGGTRSTSLAVRRSPTNSKSVDHDRRTSQPVSEVDRVKVQRGYGQLPLSFEANQGQTDKRVQFLARGDGYSLFLAPTESVLALRGPAEPGSAGVQPVPEARHGASQPNRGSVLRMKLLGGNPTTPATGLEELPGKSHYFVGNDPKQWRTNVPTYGKVRFASVYPGVDLVYYGNQRQLEYDFVVAPGADPSAIRLGFAGAERLEIDAQGELTLQTGAGEVRWHKPVVYQEVGGLRQMVDGHYVQKGIEAVGFAVAPFNVHLPLVIDPVLVYSTYLGGTGGADASSIAVDSSGSAYVTGGTASANFPTTSGAFMPQSVFAVDAYVTKMDPAGHALIYSTYLGGNGNSDNGNGIAVDASGNAYVTGRTNSFNFPTTLTAYKTTSGGGNWDAFVTKLDPTGSALLYSTYLGGSGEDRGVRVAADSSGYAHVTGFTWSANFPTRNALQTTLSGLKDAFVTKLDTNLAGSASLLYSTYLGGSLEEDGSGSANQTAAIAVDTSGYVYVTGSTDSANFPTSNAFQNTLLGGFTPNFNAFVTKIDPYLSGAASLIYSTYFGTGGSEFGTGIAVDSSGSAYVTGWGFGVPTTAGAFQTSPGGGGADAFVTKLTPDGSGLVYTTYLGGSRPDLAFGIAVDPSGSAYVTGWGSSTNFPISSAVQASAGGGNDAFVTKLKPDGSGLVYSTYLGGSADDFGQGIAVDDSGAVYVTGTTASTNFPTANPFQACCGIPSAAFVSKIADDTPPTISIDDVPAVEGNTGQTAFTFTVTLSKPGALPITVDFATADGTATAADADYVSTSGTLTFNPGETSKTVVVTVAADTVFEGAETFRVTLSHPSNATLAKATGIGTILNDDDDVPSVSIDDASVVEGNSGLPAATIVLRLSRPHDVPVTVDVTASNGTATSPFDYFGFYDENEGLYVFTTTVTFGAGEVSHTVPFYVLGDTIIEPDETVILTLSHPTQASIGKGTAVLTVVADDVQLIAINDAYTMRQDSRIVAGAVKVKNHAHSGSLGVEITSVTDVNGKAFYVVGGYGSIDPGLWVSDGTTVGTVQVRSGGLAENLIAVNGTLFFTDGHALWKSDGTLQGTMKVKDIVSGTASSNPYNLRNVNGTLFLMIQIYTQDAGRELWKSDGTVAGTVLVTPLGPSNFPLPPPPFVSIGPQFVDVSHELLYFETYGGQLWRSDGTAAGTFELKSGFHNPFSDQESADVNGALYFVSGSELWKTDGSLAGTTKVRTLEDETVWIEMSNLDGALLYAVTVDRRIWGTCNPAPPRCQLLGGSIDSEIWKVDETGASLVKVLNVESLRGLTRKAIGGRVFFIGDGWLWTTDGTPGGTVVALGTAPTDLVDANGRLIFKVNGQSIWSSDGTVNGVAPIADVKGYPVGALVASGNDVFFGNTTEDGTAQIWIGGRVERLTANDVVTGHPDLTVNVESTPAHGSVTAMPDGGFSYVPNSGFAGADSFTYTLRGGGVTSNVATVTIHVTATEVTPVNHPPVLAGVPAGTQDVSLGNSLTFQATATDPDTANTLTFSLQGSVPSGATINPQTGAFAWTPLATQLGPYTFAVRVTDNGTPSLFDEELIGISVNDTIPPVITAPSDVVVGTGPGGGATVFVSDAALGAATASDNSGGPVTITRQGVPPGNAFPVGTTTILYSGTDAAGNTASATQQVTVNDTTPPILMVPANLTTGATGPSGAAVTYAVSASDAVDGTVAASCSPASGSMFVIGTTVVACSATDAHANRATGNFSVTVNGAATQTSDLTSLVTSFALAPGLTNSLVSTLQAALDSISKGKPGACGQLTGLIQAVNAQSGKGITPAQAAQLIASATQIKAVIGCP